jgi:hypothetical protein
MNITQRPYIEWMKYNKNENDIEQESVLGFLTTFGFLKKGSQVWN